VGGSRSVSAVAPYCRRVADGIPADRVKASLLIWNAEIEGRTADLRIVDGRIDAVGSVLPRTGAVLDARGGALLPGLVDHHLHLYAMAAVARSVPCGPPRVTTAAGLAVVLHSATADRHGWLRGTGYHESVAGTLDSQALDRLHADRPVRIQHRSGAMWMLNSVAAARVRLTTAAHPGIERRDDGTPTGRIWRADAWLRTRLPREPPADLTGVGTALAGYGITTVTDATPDLDAASIAAIAAAHRGGTLPQRVQLLGAPLGARLPDGLTTGPYKIVLADSALPGLDELADRIRAAHTVDRAVAVHCVTREALVLLLAALDAAGHRAGDRIEHAAVVPPELLPDLRRRGLRVVTQPGFITDRGDDYLRDAPAADHADLYRCRSLQAAGVPVALSSDAPYGPLDPWAVIEAAVLRHTASGATVGGGERLSPAAALDAYLAAPDDPGGRPRRVRAGAEADLVLLDRPLAEALAAPGAEAVRGVVIAGRWVPRRDR
jgi:predicted amidohydrolase YtcJ